MNTSNRRYLSLAEHYRSCLKTHGDRALGMDWPREEDNLRRFAVMTEMFAGDLKAGRRVRVLDFGCGTSHYYQYLRSAGLAKRVSYTGIDVVAESIELARGKFPGNRYMLRDILASTKPFGAYDYAVINGLFTQKRRMSGPEMGDFLERILARLRPAVRVGLAFNTMSDRVDFKRRGAFHLGLDAGARIFERTFGRSFVVRHDYGLYENTFYLYKRENRP